MSNTEEEKGICRCQNSKYHIHKPKMPNYQDTNPKTKTYLGNGTSELSPECLKGMIKLMGMGALIS